MGLQLGPPPPSPLNRLQALPSAATVNAVFKRKHARTASSFEVDTGEDDDYPPVSKKICIEVIKDGTDVTSTTSSSCSSSSATGKKSKQQLESAGEESDESHTTFEEASSEDEPTSEDSDSDDKENQAAAAAAAAKTTASDFESILAKTLLNGKLESPAVVAKVEEISSTNPKVIVEHQPLPSIYELQNQTNGVDNVETLDNDHYDSGLSDDSSDGGVEEEEEEDSEDEDHIPLHNASPLYNSVLGGGDGDKIETPPVSPMLNAAKPIYQDRFWSQTSSAVTTTTTTTHSLPFQFFDQGNQRIERAENGKSYMQLGIISHTLPITPVIPPKSINGYPTAAATTTTARRIPLPSFRMIPQPVRPVCDHSNCLAKKQSHCYRSTRARMLNVSLHKLHMTRQNHKGTLRRSVLICNMLRKIENETEKEAFAENQAYFSHHQQQQMHHHHYSQQQQQQRHNQHEHHQQVIHDQHTNSHHTMDIDQYWASGSSFISSELQQHHVSSLVGASPPPTSSTPLPSYNDTYECTLKDFNTAFRVTPYSIGMQDSVGIDHDAGEREINWGSVLSLSNQSELDSISNWVSSSTTTSSTTAIISSSTVSSSSSSSSSSIHQCISSQQLPQHLQSGFEDIGWKLSADDVLRVFPNDQNVFVES